MLAPFVLTLASGFAGTTPVSSLAAPAGAAPRLLAAVPQDPAPKAQRTKVRFDIRMPDGSVPDETALGWTATDWARIQLSRDGGRRRAISLWSDAETPVGLLADSGTMTIFAGFYKTGRVTSAADVTHARYVSDPVAFDAKTLGAEPVKVQLKLRPVLVINVPKELNLPPNHVPSIQLVTPAEVAAMKNARARPMRGRPPVGPPGGVRGGLAGGRVNVLDKLQLDGRIYHFGLKEGDTWVVGIGAHGTTETFETVTMGAGETEVQFAWKGAPVPKELTLRCLDQEGEAVTIDSIDVISKLGGSSSRRMGIRHQHSDGMYTLDGSQLDHARAWPFEDRRETVTTVVLESRALGTKYVRVEKAKSEVEVHFAEPATLQVTVEGAAALPIIVRVNPVGFDEPETIESEKPNGALGDLHLQPGEYEVDVLLARDERRRGAPPGLAPRGLVLARKSIRLEAGVAHPLTMQLTDLSQATFDVENIDSRLYASIARRDIEGRNRDRLRQMVSGPGVLDFGQLPAGPYRIKFGIWYEAVDVDLPCDRKTLAPRPFSEILLSDIDPFGGFGLAGLKDGDVIIGMNGEEFDSAKEARSILFELRKDMIGVLVQRGDERLEFELDRLERNAPLGATIRPR